jgi:aminopeptidase N
MITTGKSCFYSGILRLGVKTRLEMLKSRTLLWTRSVGSTSICQTLDTLTELAVIVSLIMSLRSVQSLLNLQGRYWLPCMDNPSLRSTVTFELTAKSAHLAVANGKQVSKTDNGNGTSTTKWDFMEEVIPSYLLCIAVGDLVQVDDGDVDGMPVAHLAPAGRNAEESKVIAGELQLSFGKTKEMVKWLSDKVGLKFPWTKYFQIVSPQISGGAMENSSLVTWTDRFFCDEKLHTERGLLLDLV